MFTGRHFPKDIILLGVGALIVLAQHSFNKAVGVTHHEIISGIG